MARPRTGYLFRRLKQRHFNIDDPEAADGKIYHCVRVDGVKRSISLCTTSKREALSILKEFDRDLRIGMYENYFAHLRYRAGLKPKSKGYVRQLREAVRAGHIAARELARLGIK